jgi:hypothetical protein
VFAIALRAHMKCGFGIVVACQVSRRIGAPRAEFDSHVPASQSEYGRDLGHFASRNRLFPGGRLLIEINGSIVRRSESANQRDRKNYTEAVVFGRLLKHREIDVEHRHGDRERHRK